MTFAVGLLGGLAALGALIAASAWTSPPAERVRPSRRGSGLLPPASAAVVAAAIGLAATGWAVAGLAAGIGGWLAVRAWETRGASRAHDQARIEALAAWCEQLRDLLTAEHGIIGTIAATVRTCPAAIRPEVARLSSRLVRQSADWAVGQFATELDDPSGDLVASVLRLATTRSSRTSELLSELATTIRDRAAMRLRVEADRAGHRSEARFVIVFSGLVVLGVLVFGRGSEFLAAYDDTTGQLVLAVVIGLFGIGGWWLQRLTRFDRPARVLAIGGAPVAANEIRSVDR